MFPNVIPQIEYLGMFLGIVFVIRLLKWQSIFNNDHQKVFDRLVTEFGMPAIVFAFLATTDMYEFLKTDWLAPVAIMIAAILVIIGISWIVCRAIGLEPAATGSIILLSAFGSTYTVGWPVISIIFGATRNLAILGHAICVLGVVLPLYTIGILVAGYLGHADKRENFGPQMCLKKYISSPIFIAFILGLCLSIILNHFPIPGVTVFSDVCFDFFAVLRHALHLFVWIAVGLMLAPIRLRRFLPLLALVIILHMILLPGLVVTGSMLIGLPRSEIFLDEIIALMPSGAIATVIASRYGCDGKLASGILIGTYVISLITIPILLPILSGG